MEWTDCTGLSFGDLFSPPSKNIPFNVNKHGFVWIFGCFEDKHSRVKSDPRSPECLAPNCPIKGQLHQCNPQISAFNCCCLHCTKVVFQWYVKEGELFPENPLNILFQSSSVCTFVGRPTLDASQRSRNGKVISIEKSESTDLQQFTAPGAYYVFAPGYNFNPGKRSIPMPATQQNETEMTGGNGSFVSSN